MSWFFQSTASQYVERDAGIISGHPLAIACWFRTQSVSINESPIFVGSSGSIADFWGILVRGSSHGGNPPLEAALRQPTTGVITASTSTIVKADRWHHGLAIFASSTDRRALLDGGGKGTNATSVSPSTPNRISIGRFGDSTPSDYWSGLIAEVGVWDLTPYGTTATERADHFENIAKVVLLQQPANALPLGLLAYYPLRAKGSVPLDEYGPNHLTTIVGAVPSDLDPPIRLRRRRSVPVKAVSVALTIDTFESVAVADNARVGRNLGLVRSEAISTVDVRAVSGPPLVSETITVTDNVSTVVHLKLQRQEIVSTVENRKVVIPKLPVLRLENVTVLDVVTPRLNVGITTTYYPLVWLSSTSQPFTRSVGESIATVDVVTTSVTPLEVAVSETATVTDQPSISPSLSISRSDTSTVTDVAARVLTLHAAPSEAITIVDTSKTTTGFRVFESVTSTDTSTQAIHLAPQRSETVTSTDVHTVVSHLGTRRIETVMVTENAPVTLGAVVISEIETINVTDSPQVVTPLGIRPVDTISSTDSVSSVLVPLTVTPFDAVSVIDADPTIVMPLSIVEGESVTVTDTTTAFVTPLTVSRSESVAVDDPQTVAVTTQQTLTTSSLDFVTVVDTPIMVMHLGRSVSDAASVSDVSSAVVTPAVISVSEVIAISEATVTLVTPLVVRPFEGVTVAEFTDTLGLGELFPAFVTSRNLTLTPTRRNVPIS